MLIQCFEEMQCILLQGQAVQAWGLGLYDREVEGTFRTLVTSQQAWIFMLHC